MNFRTKIFFTLVVIAIISSSFGLLVEHKELKQEFFDDYQHIATTLVDTTASLTTLDLLKTIDSSEDQTSHEPPELYRIFREVINQNARVGVTIDHLFLLMPSKERPNSFDIILNVSENGDHHTSHDRRAWDEAAFYELSKHRDKPYSPEKLITDHRGSWIAAFAPILDTKGNYVATVGVDIEGFHFLNTMHQLLEYQLIGLVASIILALVGGLYLAGHLTDPLRKLYRGVEEINKGNFSQVITIKTRDEFWELASSFNTMSKLLSEGTKIKMGFEHYLTHDVFDRLLKEKSAFKLDGDVKQVTILCAHIGPFSEIAESLPPEKLFPLVNQYFREILNLVFKNHGMIDKFYSDQMVVVFGVPLDDPNQEMNALQTAIEMQEKLRPLNEIQNLEQGISIRLNIAIHTGEAVLGTIGSPQKKEYTLIGKTLKTAGAILQHAVQNDYPILISDDTYSKVHETFSLETAGDLTAGDPSERKKIHLYSVKE